MSGWTEDRVATLKKLWLEGKSGGEIQRAIAERHWKPSRSAVIGKLSRMGLCGEDRAKKPAAPRPIKRDLTGFRVSTSARTGLPTGLKVAPTPPVKSAPLATSSPRHWMTRRNGECCWPVSGDGADVFSCCARVAVYTAGGGYCAGHNAKRVNARTPVSVKELARSLRRFA